MQTVQFNQKVSLDFQSILEGFSELPLSDLEYLMGELSQIVEKRKNTSTEDRVQILINKIKHGGPGQHFHDRLRQLATASVREEITEAERKELLEMIPISENWAVERLKYMITLSEIWEISIDGVMQKLDIKTPESIYA